MLLSKKNNICLQNVLTENGSTLVKYKYLKLIPKPYLSKSKLGYIPSLTSMTKFVSTYRSHITEACKNDIFHKHHHNLSITLTNIKTVDYIL